MTEPFDAFLQFHKDSKGNLAGNFSRKRIPNLDSGEEGLPNVRLELLQAQGKPPVRRIHLQDDHLQFLALFQDLRGMLGLACPGKVGKMDQPVHPLFNFHKGAEIGQIPDGALDEGPLGVPGYESRPRIIDHLFQAEGDAALGSVQVQNHHFHRIPYTDHLGGMSEPLAPRHLRDVDQPFYAPFQFHKGAVIGNTADPAFHPAFHSISFRDTVPRVLGQLLQSQRYSALFRVEVKNLHRNFLV